MRAIDTKVRQIETVKKEESLRKTQEVWKHIREMEEEWLYKEEGWFYKESRMEKEVKLLILQNTYANHFCSTFQRKNTKMICSLWVFRG